jgi:hypothetical protein
MVYQTVGGAMKMTDLANAKARESNQTALSHGRRLFQQVDGPSEKYQQGRSSNTMKGFAQPALLARAYPHPHHQTQSQHHQTIDRTASQVPPPSQTRTPKNAVTDILPYCTTEPPLRQDQVIALSDVVGNIKELVLLAMGAAAGDVESVDKMKGAVGPETTKNIVEFFAEEWEVE